MRWMNITLSIDDELLARARKLAAERNTSLNNMVREQLRHLTSAADQQRLVDQLEALWQCESQNAVEGDYRWNRKDAYDRSLLR